MTVQLHRAAPRRVHGELALPAARTVQAGLRHDMELGQDRPEDLARFFQVQAVDGGAQKVRGPGRGGERAVAERIDDEKAEIGVVEQPVKPQGIERARRRFLDDRVNAANVQVVQSRLLLTLVLPETPEPFALVHRALAALCPGIDRAHDFIMAWPRCGAGPFVLRPEFSSNRKLQLRQIANYEILENRYGTRKCH